MTSSFTFMLMAFSVLFLSISIFLSSKHYQKKFSQPFSIKNMFPFEFNYRGVFADNFGGNLTLILSCVFLMATFGTFEGSHTNGYATFVLVIGIFSSALIGLLFFVPFDQLKTHLALSSFQFVFAFILGAAMSFLNIFYYYQNKNYLNIISAIISGLIALFVMVLIANPKLSLRFKSKEVKQKNGEIAVERPNWIIYAFTEWMCIFSVYLEIIPLLIFIISLY